MASRMMYVTLLVAAALVGSGQALKCHTCVNEETNQACMDNGVIITCPEMFNTCQTSAITDSDGMLSVSKSCAVEATCTTLVNSELCTGLADAGSICYCCCGDSDKCNSDVCGMEEEEEEECESNKSSSGKSNKSSSGKSNKSSSGKSNKSSSGKSNKSNKSNEKKRKRRSGSKSNKSCKSGGMHLLASPIMLLSALLARKLW